RFGNLYRKAENNPTAGQQNPIAYTAIEETTMPGTGDIDKATNRFRTSTTYNDAGQVVTDNKFRTMSFAYDANGRQVKASRTSVLDAWTVYDVLGNRVATKINDIWQYVVYDAFGKVVAEYGQLADGLGGVKYVQQDWQGSVRAVTNANGFVVSRTDHQAFGGEIGYGTGLRSIEQGYNVDKATRQGYGLTERDEATGLDHTWFRKNENTAGRWTSADPYNGSMKIGNPQSFNRYSYVGSDPLNHVDPSGLDRLDDAIVTANYLLNSKPCANLFKGKDAESLLKNTRIRTPSSQPATYNSGGIVTSKKWTNPMIAITSGKAKGIYIDPNGAFYANSGRLGIGFGIFLDNEDYSVLILLHELAHIAKVIPHDAGNVGGQGYMNNAKIFVFCFLMNPEWRKAPVETTPPTVPEGGISPRTQEPLLQPGGAWGQADWSFYMLGWLAQMSQTHVTVRMVD
ncbi:MAG: hypothetical protein HOP17_16485, partial [Acidobacteria bacterium]|nr:hypothetical protein [Acidobacteriota bacterium]